AVPTLIQRLKESKGYARAGIAKALAAIGPDAKDAVPALVAVFKEQDLEAQYEVTEAIGRIGKAAVAELKQNLNDPDLTIQRCMKDSLGSIGADASDAISDLIDLIKNPDCLNRFTAAWALAKIGKPALEPLQKCLSESDSGTREYAVEALGRMGQSAK